jgi:protein-disulfide isomerase
MVNIWESRDAASEARHFAEIWDLQGTILLDETGEYAGALGIHGVPSNVVVDANGVVRAVGVATPAELEEAIADR